MEPSSLEDSNFPAVLEIDDRERSETLAQAAVAFGLIPVRRRLAAGDLVVDGRWRIERKTREDFVRSLDDGRLFRQLVAMRRYPGVPLLVIEHSGHEGPLATDRTASVMLSIVLDLDIPVITSGGPHQTIRLVSRLIAKTRRTFRESRPPKIAARRLGPASRVLMAVEGLGPKRVADLLAAFGSLASVFAADAESLGTAPGIGPVLGRRLERLFRMPISEGQQHET